MLNKPTTPPIPPPILFPPDPIPKVLLGGSVNILASPPNVGKTAFLATFLRKLYLGEPIFGRQPNPVPKVVVVSIDRSWHQSSQLWYNLAGWTDADLTHYSLQDDRTFDINKLGQRTRRMEILRYCLDPARVGELPLGTLVVIDPITPFLGGNLMDYDACMVACSKLRRLCQEKGITLIGVCHAGKQKNDKKEQYRRLQDRLIGSTAQLGFTDTSMYLASPEETGEKFYTFLWAPHHIPVETHPLGRDANGLFVPWGEGQLESEAKTVMDCLPMDESDPKWEKGEEWGLIVVASGVKKSKVWELLQDGIKHGTVEKVSHGHYRRIRLN